MRDKKDLKSKLILEEKPLLKDFQEYVRKAVKERGFEDETPQDIMLLLQEEFGELAEAVRKSIGIKYSRPRKRSIEIELADIFIYILDLANYFDVDLEEAFRKKEEINKRKKWFRNKND